MLDILKIVGLFALYIYACWLVYILVMGLYRAHLAGRLPRDSVLFWVAVPVVVVGYVMDALLHILATIPFLDAPRLSDREWLLTQRLKRYMDGRDGWRKRVAEWICTHMLDPFDARGDHC